MPVVPKVKKLFGLAKYSPYKDRLNMEKQATDVAAQTATALYLLRNQATSVPIRVIRNLNEATQLGAHSSRFPILIREMNN